MLGSDEGMVVRSRTDFVDEGKDECKVHDNYSRLGIVCT